MKLKKILLLALLSSSLTACFDETEGKDVEPESMADCIAIENPNNRDICKTKLEEKLKQALQESHKTTLGDGKLDVVDW